MHQSTLASMTGPTQTESDDFPLLCPNDTRASEQICLPDEQATEDFARSFASRLRGGETVFVNGELGVGKTTLIRGILRALGVRSHVRSPTYTLVESYQTLRGPAVHLDLYRLAQPAELEFVADGEFWARPALRLIEWPDHGRGFLPNPDIQIHLALLPHGRALELTDQRLSARKGG